LIARDTRDLTAADLAEIEALIKARKRGAKKQ
jgi:hypothetical protein